MEKGKDFLRCDKERTCANAIIKVKTRLLQLTIIKLLILLQNILALKKDLVIDNLVKERHVLTNKYVPLTHTI